MLIRLFCYFHAPSVIIVSQDDRLYIELFLWRTDQECNLLIELTVEYKLLDHN